jgi:hypothetical protein
LAIQRVYSVQRRASKNARATEETSCDKNGCHLLSYPIASVYMMLSVARLQAQTKLHTRRSQAHLARPPWPCPRRAALPCRRSPRNGKKRHTSTSTRATLGCAYGYPLSLKICPGFSGSLSLLASPPSPFDRRSLRSLLRGNGMGQTTCRIIRMNRPRDPATVILRRCVGPIEHTQP